MLKVVNPATEQVICAVAEGDRQMVAVGLDRAGRAPVEVAVRLLRHAQHEVPVLQLYYYQAKRPRTSSLSRRYSLECWCKSRSPILNPGSRIV